MDRVKSYLSSLSSTTLLHRFHPIRNLNLEFTNSIQCFRRGLGDPLTKMKSGVWENSISVGECIG